MYYYSKMSDTKLTGDAIVFLNVPKAYLPQEDLTVRFERSKDLPVGTRDWVGLFRVGWTTTRDYYTFEWAPTPSGDTADNTNNKIVFSGRRLPPDDGCFYQFCYVSREGVMRGASGPFQFTKAAPGLNLDDVESVDVVEEGLESIVELRRKDVEDPAIAARPNEEIARTIPATEMLPLKTVAFEEVSRQPEYQLEELAQSKKRIAALEADNAAAVRSNADMTTRFNEAQNQIKTYRDMQNKLSERLDKELATCMELKDTKEKLNTRCQEMEMASDKLKAQCQQLAAEKADLVKQLNSAVQQRDGLEATLCAKLQAAKESRDEMEKLVEQSGHKIRELEEFLTTREDELHTMQQQFGTQKQQLERLLEEQKTSSATQQQLKGKSQQLEARLLEQQTAHAVEVRQLQQRAQAAEELNVQLKARLVESERNSEVLKKELADVQIKNDLNVADDIRPMCAQPPAGYVDKAAHEALQIAYDNMEKYYRKVSAELEGCNVRLSESQVNASKFADQCEELKKRIELGKVAYENLGKENANLKRTLRGLEEQNKVAEPRQRVGEEEKWRALAAEASRREEQCQRKIRELEEELRRMEDGASRQAEEDKLRISELEEKLAGEEHRGAVLVQEKADQEGQYVTTIQELEHQLSSKHAELLSVTGQLAEEKERTASKERDMAQLQEHCDDAVQELTKRNEECLQQDMTIKGLEDEKAQGLTRIQSLEVQVLELQKKCRALSGRVEPVYLPRPLSPTLTRICPICSTRFPKRMLQTEFEQHVQGHFNS